MSKMSVNTLEFTWRIKNVETWLQKRDDPLYSPQLVAEALANTRWKLGLSQNWQLAEKYVSLFLQRDVENGGPQLIEVNYEFSFLARDGLPLTSISYAKKFASKTVSNQLNVKQIEILREKKDYLPDGVLTIRCKLWNTLSSIPKVQFYTLMSVIGSKRIALETTIENFNSSSSAIVNFLPHSEDISMISLEVFISFESGKNTYEFGFSRRHVECKGVCWYSLMLLALDNKGNSRTFRECSNLIKRPSEISQVLKRRKIIPETVFSYYKNNILNLKLIVYYHPGVVSESIESEFSNHDDLPGRTGKVESMKASKVLITSSNSSCVSSTKFGKDEEYLNFSVMTNLLLPTLEDASTASEDESTALKDETTSFKDETTALKDETTSFKDEKTTQEDETALDDETTALIDESISLIDESIALIDESIARKEESSADNSNTLNDPENMKMYDFENAPSTVSNFLSSTELGNDEEERLDSSIESNLPLTTLRDDLTSLYNERLFSDANLQFDTETLSAHRNVLSARSPVFKKMFMTCTKKKPDECIQISGISPDTGRRMLQFLYTDCTGELDMQSAKDLYFASNTYGITSLKARCSTFMKKNLNLSNVCDVLVIADMYHDKDLESSAQEYVLTNDSEVFYSEKWKLFIKKNSGLAAEVMYLKLTKTKYTNSLLIGSS